MESTLLTSGMMSERLRRLQLKDRRSKPLTRAEHKRQTPMVLLTPRTMAVCLPGGSVATMADSLGSMGA